MIESRYDRILEIGQKVRVYKNLNKGCFSIMDATTKRVLGYADTVTLENVQFDISVASQRRAREQGKRNVHAFATGTFIAAGKAKPRGVERIAYYNPFETDTFIDPITKAVLTSARIAHLEDGKCFVL